MIPKKLKITRLPGTDRVGPVWEIPELPEEIAERVNIVEPGELIIFNELDGSVETKHIIADLPTEVHEGKSLLDFTRAAWKKNGGYPPGHVRMRPEAFPGEPLEDRMTPEPAAWKPTPGLARRKSIADKIGNPHDKAIVGAEEDLEREAFAKWLEERKRLGPG